MPDTTLRVVTSNATHSLLGALVEAYGRVQPHQPVELTADSASLMLERIRNGECADLAVLNAPDINALVQAGILDARTRRSFTRSRIGVAVRAGAPHPDIASADAFRRTLLAARAIAHTVHGASGMYVPKLIERLGIADQVTTVTRPGGLIGKVVAAGEAEIAIQQISELLAVEGIEVVGPLPDELQMTFDSALAAFAGSPHAEAASSLVNFFLSPDVARLFESHGLQRL